MYEYDIISVVCEQFPPQIIHMILNINLYIDERSSVYQHLTQGCPTRIMSRNIFTMRAASKSTVGRMWPAGLGKKFTTIQWSLLCFLFDVYFEYYDDTKDQISRKNGNRKINIEIIIFDILLNLIVSLKSKFNFWDSERSDENIDFTMLCVFFLSLCTLERVEIMLQFQNMGMVSCRKMSLVGALGSHFLNFTIVFKSAGKNQKKKIKKKREFLRKTSFRPNRFFYMVVIQKLITCDKKNLDHQKVPYEFSNFYEICRKRENLQRNENDLSSNVFFTVDKNFLAQSKYLKI
ncbi:Uncharacterized protein FWK35_00003260 [Aphis craccivora]|uniref:Uncharacterized protein n=1 Tax=Aphis craccivora TaxID=307492 RepID=A0A6G0Z5J3_APHCR|nr:Uncharacterized protein FWK35_00003260 [Aphis craccivora]